MKEFENTLLDISCNNINAVAKKHNDIDNKAIGIITISGILISFLASSLSSEATLDICLLTIFFILTTLSFLTTVFLSILVLKPREASEVSTLNFINELRNEKKEHQIRRIIETSAEIEDELQDICRKKALGLSKAITALGISVMILIIYTILTFFYGI